MHTLTWAARVAIHVTDSDDTPLPERLERTSRASDDAVDRCRFLRSSTAASAAAAAATGAGCTELATDDGGSAADEDADGDGDSRTVFVFNTGDGTISVVDASADEVVETVHVGVTASYPANQYATIDSSVETLWLNVEGGVRGVAPDSLADVASVDTGAEANWQEVTPGGEHLIVSAREPTHAQFRVDADPASGTFGEVTGEIDRGGAGPCDVTVGPDGAYAYVPDIGADTLTVVDVDKFAVAAQVGVDAVAEGVDSARPYMGTAAWSGEWLAVENAESDHGTESIWDVSDPESPEERRRFTEADGLGAGALTSEVGPDSETLYVFTPDSEDVTVIDVPGGEVVDRLDLGGSAQVGSWDPAREKLYAPVQDSDEVAVIDHAAGEITARIDVGAAPVGVTARRVRPDSSAIDRFRAAVASLGVDLGGTETTYCHGDCYCAGECG